MNDSIINTSYPFLIDGGISNELESQGCDLNHKLWTAHLLESDIEAIIKVHLNYLRAGAQCIATCSYQASIPGLIEHGYSQKKAKELIIKSVKAAEDAREIYYKENNEAANVLIAASIGPYGAYLADGSEYKGNYNLTKTQLKDFHYERIMIMDKSNADILAFETIPDFLETEAIGDILRHTTKPAWISFSCRDNKHISDGTPISKCAALLADHPGVFAIGVNCVPPDFIPGLIKALKSQSKQKKIIIYPNSGGYYDSAGKKWYANDDPFSLKNHIHEWIDLGANIIGGCCKIGADEIKNASAVLNN